MITDTIIHEKLRSMLNDHRYKHSIGVQETAIMLAKQNGADVKKASIAGLIHDCAKDLSNDILINIAEKDCGIYINDIYRIQPELLHGLVGAYVAQKEFGIYDEDIIHSIKYHTTGCLKMSMLDKIIYIADYIEPGRDFPGVNNIRELTLKNINKGVLMALDNTIKFIIERGQLLDSHTVEARNWMILNYCL